MKILIIGLLGAALLTSGTVAAKHYSDAKRPARADQFYDFYQSPPQMLAPSKVDWADFDQSRTRGREGLGGSPFHPEGPSNVAE
jgi:hypothetical protein